MKNRFGGLWLTISILFLLTMLTANCANTSAKLPQDISGISIGMEKAAAEQRLSEIAVFEREESKRQQIWRVKDDARFNYIAVGYDEKNQIRYVTAFVDKETEKEKIHFSDVGDLTRAKAEIVAPFHRYIWEVATNEGKPAYQVIVNGDNAEFVTIYSLNKMLTPGEAQETEDDD